MLHTYNFKEKKKASASFATDKQMKNKNRKNAKL